MIQQQPGDILEVEFEGKFYYLVVVTKIFMFGGNIIYAFHGDGSRISEFEPSPHKSGFNICTDLLLPKKQGIVRRLGKTDHPEKYLVSKLIKGCHAHHPGEKATKWWISTVDSPTEYIAQVRNLSKEQAIAMDAGMMSFDLTANKILSGYTPDKNPFIKKAAGLVVFSLNRTLCEDGHD